MDFLSIVILGLVQGITEWIPVSSKTQDTLVYLKILNGDPSLVVPILLYLHIGTLLAAILYFRKELLGMAAAIIKKPMEFKEHAEGKPGFLFTALLFTGIVGVPLLIAEKEYFPDLDGSMLFVLMGMGLVFTGILLLRQKGAKSRTAGQVGWKDGILTGLLQGLSTLPGVSRSGTSTSGLIWSGFDSESSFHLSFLLSIPTVVMAEIVLYVAGGLAPFPLMDGILLALASFVFGYLTLEALLRMARKVNLSYVVLSMGVLIIAVGILGMG
jgi:undecaprenyl-diphosphatase